MYKNLAGLDAELNMSTDEHKKNVKHKKPLFYLLAQVDSDVKFMDDIENEIEKEQQKKEANESPKATLPSQAMASIETTNSLTKTDHGLLQEIELKNFNNQQYVGNIFIGDNH